MELEINSHMEGKEKSFEKTVEDLMKIPGEVRGVSIKADWAALSKKEGEESLRKLEARMEELGYPLKYKDIKETTFYPIGLDALSVVLMEELFNFTKRDFEEIGAMAVNFSIILKLFMKYFVSLKLAASQMPVMWHRYYTVGDLEVSEINEEKNYMIIKLKNFALHPICCITMGAYSAKLLSMVINKPVICEETKCTFRGDQYQEYLLKW